MARKGVTNAASGRLGAAQGVDRGQGGEGAKGDEQLCDQAGASAPCTELTGAAQQGGDAAGG